MRTERQKQASRENGSKSRGATTPEGKLASSRNATKHGLLSGTIVLECESTDRFLSLVAALHEEFQPQTPFEESLIESMAAARWRQFRIWGMEKAGMDYEMRRHAEATNSSEDAATRAAIVFRNLSNDGRSLELINRYDSRCERQYYRAHRRFLEVRDLRTTPPPDRPTEPRLAQVFPFPPPVPEPETGKVLLPNEPEPPAPEPMVRRTAVSNPLSSVFIRGQMILTRFRDRMTTRRTSVRSAAIIPLQHNPAS